MAKAEVEPVGDPLDAKVAAAEPATAAIDAVPATTNGARTASKERVPTRRERRRVRGPKLRPSYDAVLLSSEICHPDVRCPPRCMFAVRSGGHLAHRASMHAASLLLNTAA